MTFSDMYPYGDNIETLDAETISDILAYLSAKCPDEPHAIVEHDGETLLKRRYMKLDVGDTVRLICGADQRCVWQVYAAVDTFETGDWMRWYTFSEGAALRAGFTATGASAPAFKIKAWGKFRVLLRGPRTGNELGPVLGELLIDVRSPHGLEDIALGESGWVAPIQRNLRRVEELLCGIEQRLSALEGPRSVDSDATQRVLDDIEARLAYLEGTQPGGAMALEPRVAALEPRVAALEPRVAALEATAGEVASVAEALRGANADFAQLRETLRAVIEAPLDQIGVELAPVDAPPTTRFHVTETATFAQSTGTHTFGGRLRTGVQRRGEHAPVDAPPAEDWPSEVIVRFDGAYGMGKGQTGTIHTDAGSAKVIACEQTREDGATPMRLASPAHPPLSTVVKLFDAVHTDSGLTGRVTKIL